MADLLPYDRINWEADEGTKLNRFEITPDDEEPTYSNMLWKPNLTASGTPLSVENLNHMDEYIKYLSENLMPPEFVLDDPTREYLLVGDKPPTYLFGAAEYRLRHMNVEGDVQPLSAVSYYNGDETTCVPTSTTARMGALSTPSESMNNAMCVYSLSENLGMIKEYNTAFAVLVEKNDKGSLSFGTRFNVGYTTGSTAAPKNTFRALKLSGNLVVTTYLGQARLWTIDSVNKILVPHAGWQMLENNTVSYMQSTAEVLDNDYIALYYSLPSTTRVRVVKVDINQTTGFVGTGVVAEVGAAITSNKLFSGVYGNRLAVWGGNLFTLYNFDGALTKLGQITLTTSAIGNIIGIDNNNFLTRYASTVSVAPTYNLITYSTSLSTTNITGSSITGVAIFRKSFIYDNVFLLQGGTSLYALTLEGTRLNALAYANISATIFNDTLLDFGDKVWAANTDGTTASPVFDFDGTNFTLESNETYRAFAGICVAIDDDGTAIIQKHGLVDGFIGLTAGSFYYATDNGAITTTAPASGNAPLRVGYAVTDTILQIKEQ